MSRSTSVRPSGSIIGQGARVALDARHPNGQASLERLASRGALPARRVWGMLALRTGLSLAMVVSLAALFAGLGGSAPFAAAAAWWLWVITAVNVVSLGLMARYARVEGMRLRDLWYFRRETWRGDVAWAVVGLAGAAVLGQLPGAWLAGLLWTDPATPNALLIQPIPVLAVLPLLVLMPIIHAFAELPTYWGYVAPRLRARGMGRWTVILVVGAFLSLQHLGFSFQLDWRYDLWLAVKFLPFALWTGFLVDRRPSVLPYLMGAHGLLDATLPILVLVVSRGGSL